MLVLSRRLHERIRVDAPDGSVLWLVPTKISGNHVTLGIEAPAGYRVRREELYIRDQQEEHGDDGPAT